MRHKPARLVHHIPSQHLEIGIRLVGLQAQRTRPEPASIRSSANGSVSNTIAFPPPAVPTSNSRTRHRRHRLLWSTAGDVDGECHCRLAAGQVTKIPGHRLGGTWWPLLKRHRLWNAAGLAPLSRKTVIAGSLSNVACRRELTDTTHPERFGIERPTSPAEFRRHSRDVVVAVSKAASRPARRCRGRLEHRCPSKSSDGRTGLRIDRPYWRQAGRSRHCAADRRRSEDGDAGRDGSGAAYPRPPVNDSSSMAHAEPKASLAQLASMTQETTDRYESSITEIG